MDQYSSSPRPRRALIVEDEIVIALDLQDATCSSSSPPSSRRCTTPMTKGEKTVARSSSGPNNYSSPVAMRKGCARQDAGPIATQ